MKNIFIDTNILLDVIRHREGFYEDASKVWADCESHKVRGFISAISLNNVYYIVRKLVPPDTALTYIRLMLNVFSIVPLDETILRLSVDFKLRRALVQKAVRYIKAEDISLEEAVEIFLIQIIRHEGRPFSEWIGMIPDSKTLAVMKEAKRIAQDPDVKGYTDVEALLRELKK